MGKGRRGGDHWGLAWNWGRGSPTPGRCISSSSQEGGALVVGGPSLETPELGRNGDVGEQGHSITTLCLDPAGRRPLPAKLLRARLACAATWVALQPEVCLHVECAICQTRLQPGAAQLMARGSPWPSPPCPRGMAAHWPLASGVRSRTQPSVGGDPAIWPLHKCQAQPQGSAAPRASEAPGLSEGTALQVSDVHGDWRHLPLRCILTTGASLEGQPSWHQATRPKARREEGACWLTALPRGASRPHSPWALLAHGSRCR